MISAGSAMPAEPSSRPTRTWSGSSPRTVSPEARCGGAVRISGAGLTRAAGPARPLVRSLTELFEYAQFSPHEIDETMKEQAIESLVAVKKIWN